MNEFILLVLINAALARAVIVYWRKNSLDSTFKGIRKYIVILLAAWILFSVLFGLFQTFDALEMSKEDATKKVISGIQISLQTIAIGILFFFGIFYLFGRKINSSKTSSTKIG
jgi:hypothetical protein